MVIRIINSPTPWHSVKADSRDFSWYNLLREQLLLRTYLLCVILQKISQYASYITNNTILMIIGWS